MGRMVKDPQNMGKNGRGRKELAEAEAPLNGEKRENKIIYSHCESNK